MILHLYSGYFFNQQINISIFKFEQWFITLNYTFMKLNQNLFILYFWIHPYIYN